MAKYTHTTAVVISGSIYNCDTKIVNGFEIHWFIPSANAPSLYLKM